MHHSWNTTHEKIYYSVVECRLSKFNHLHLKILFQLSLILSDTLSSMLLIQYKYWYIYNTPVLQHPKPTTQVSFPKYINSVQVLRILGSRLSVWENTNGTSICHWWIHCYYIYLLSSMTNRINPWNDYAMKDYWPIFGLKK